MVLYWISLLLLVISFAGAVWSLTAGKTALTIVAFSLSGVSLLLLIHKTAELVSEITTSSERQSSSAIRFKHLQWNSKVRDYLDGRSVMRKEEAVSHFDCPLGRSSFAS